VVIFNIILHSLMQMKNQASYLINSNEYDIVLFQPSIGWVHLGPLGTEVSNSPIVPTPGDFEDGKYGDMMIGRGDRSTRRKPSSVPLCPPHILHAVPGREPGPPRWESSD
jgi:hypothetical protein